MIRSLTRFALAALLTSAVSSPLHAQLFRRARVCPPPVVVACPPVVVVATPPVKPPKSNAKTVSVNFDAKPWGEVLDWFAKESGMVLIATDRPIGTLTLKTDPNRKYTIPEVIDLLNTSLAYKKFILLRINPTTFTVVPADEKIPDQYVQRIKQDDLNSRAYTEVVECVIELKDLDAYEILAQVRARQGMFGTAKVIDSTHLLIRDTAGNIRSIIADLKKCCEVHGDSLTYPCKFHRASEMAAHLTKLLSDSSTTSTVCGRPGEPSPFGRSTPPVPSRDRTDLSSRFRTVNITVQERTNTIIITGPADKLATAEKLLKELDVGRPGQNEYQASEPTLKIYTVPAKTAESLARILSEKYGSSKTVRIAVVPGKDEIMVLAPAHLLSEIAPQPTPCMNAVPCPPSPVACPRPVGLVRSLFARLRR